MGNLSRMRIASIQNGKIELIWHMCLCSMDSRVRMRIANNQDYHWRQHVSTFPRSKNNHVQTRIANNLDIHRMQQRSMYLHSMDIRVQRRIADSQDAHY